MSPSRRNFLLLAAGGIASRSAADTPSRQELAGMEGVASAFMTAHSIPGLTVAVVRGGNLLYERGFGFADRDKNEKVTPQSLFRIASVSKPITSVTLFLLIEAKRLTMEDTVFGPRGLLGDDFGKRPYQRWVEDIRIKHLLTHTGGGWQNNGSDPMFRNPGMNHKQLITWAVNNVPLDYPRGNITPTPISATAFWDA